MTIPLELFLQKWGPTGLLGLFILGILFGRLVPLIFYNDVRKQRDEWKLTAQEALRQNTILLESTRVANATFHALKKVATQEEEPT